MFAMTKKRLLSLLVERSNSWCSARARERVGVDSQVRTADGPGGRQGVTLGGRAALPEKRHGGVEHHRGREHDDDS